MPSTFAFALIDSFPSFKQSRAMHRAVTDTLLIVAGSVVMALLAQLSFPLPFSPVPITGQTLGVLLVASALGSRRGTASIALYLLEGCAGLPVFAGGTGTIAVLMGPTAGYLLGFVPAAYLTGLLAERGMDRSPIACFASFIAAQSLVIILGTAWLSLFIGTHAAFVGGLLPFVPGEVVKAAIAAGLLPSAWKLLRR